MQQPLFAFLADDQPPPRLSRFERFLLYGGLCKLLNALAAVLDWLLGLVYAVLDRLPRTEEPPAPPDVHEGDDKE